MGAAGSSGNLLRHSSNSLKRQIANAYACDHCAGLQTAISVI